TPRQHNMYSIDLNNIVPHNDLTCLVAKASAGECILWHRRLGHLNVKTMNKLVRHNLVRGLPTKSFDNDHTCTACLKGKQHKASCKSKLVNSVTKPLHTLHMDLFGPTSVSSISHKWYCLVAKASVDEDNLGKFKAKGDEGYFIGYKDAARQEVKKDVSSLRYIALPNWIHEIHLESSSSQPQETCNSYEPESSGNSNPTATSTNPVAD
nr:ribonuclease H-like domain-containing protein [Tanacetum cinerariifolium]